MVGPPSDVLDNCAAPLPEPKGDKIVKPVIV